jgi:hypothetical protein
MRAIAAAVPAAIGTIGISLDGAAGDGRGAGVAGDCAGPVSIGQGDQEGALSSADGGHGWAPHWPSCPRRLKEALQRLRSPDT